ncbi:MAG: cyclase family protein [Alphaproteobacteria bacterium]|nr:MAG: cyclase family protein [Alphaproteobacteria bacterium]
MCDVCVMNAVKERMLSRRDFFRAGAAATAAAAVSTVASAPPAMAAGHGEVVDLTHTYDPAFPTYFGQPGIAMAQKFNFADNGFNLFEVTLNEHTGTHIDAPLHFSADGASVDAIAVENLVVPLCVIHIHERAAQDPDAQVTPDDIKAWIARNGPVPERACVAMHSGWEKRAGGDGFRNADDKGVMHFPGFHIEATQMLLEETSASAIGVDTLSLDYGPSQDFVTHYAWLPAGRYGIENLKNLAKLPEAGATIVVGAPTHRGGSGGPARIFALV